jgi:Tannase-like family of unknown function (DUF6351)
MQTQSQRGSKISDRASRRWTRLLSVSIALLSALVAGVGYAAPSAKNHLVITTLSTAPDRVSGGDVLVKIDVPRATPLSDVQVRLNGADVTSVFLPDSTSDALVGLVTGLRNGDNVLTAAIKRSKSSHNARLEIHNFPIYGPIFAGPHQTPWICETDTSGLGPSLDEHCTVASRYDWFYRATDNTFKPLLSLSPPFPSDLATTTTIDGHTVNYIVRVESGTIDQSIYRIAILDDPTHPIHNPWTAGGAKPGPGWNGKLSFPFGGGCGPAYRSGRNVVTSALSHDPLSLGFAVAFGTRNTLWNGCDEVISAETLMMIKEHFIEQYGLPKFTIGSGGSGGSIQQHFIAPNYPGLLDALTPGVSYPDVVTIVPDVVDCGLLNNYFNNIANPATWPGSRRSKITGYPATAAGIETCTSWDTFAHTWQTPFVGFDPVVPVADRYDPVTNPTGARGDFWTGMVNVFGIDPHTGFARSGYDNVGVQYGLRALNAGGITPEEFLDLNAKIGGLDVDGHNVPARSEANLEAVEIAYRSGLVDSGENLTLPIIDTRNYLDDLANIHTRIRTFAKLERLMRANGTTANEVNWLTANVGTVPNLARMALLAHNQWLENIRADTSEISYAEKVIRNKPASLKDTCWDAAGVAHEEAFTLNGSSVCNTLFPINSTVRIQAGGPIAGDILKCHLKPIHDGDYAVTFTSEQRARLKAIFPQGVCDYSRPGVRQHSMEGVWLDYTHHDLDHDR